LNPEPGRGRRQSNPEGLPCSTGGWDGKGAYRELLGIGPRHLGELLDGDRAAAGVEAAPVHEIGRLLAALRHDVPRREAGRGGAQLRERELLERRHLAGAGASRGGRRRRRRLVLVERVGGTVRGERPRRLLLRVRPRPLRGAAATHRSPPPGGWLPPRLRVRGVGGQPSVCGVGFRGWTGFPGQ
jgi:hypothetical protein